MMNPVSYPPCSQRLQLGLTGTGVKDQQKNISFITFAEQSSLMECFSHSSKIIMFKLTLKTISSSDF
jgi:hypothetical protein